MTVILSEMPWDSINATGLIYYSKSYSKENNEWKLGVVNLTMMIY